MALLGSSVLQNLYQEFLDTELGYSQEGAQGLGVLPNESTLKCQGDFFHCVIHSASFRTAKIVVRMAGAQWRAMELGSRLATLTMTYLQPKTAKKELFQFNGTLQLLQQHGPPDGDWTILLGLTFSHRPPEGFLQAQGAYLQLKKEANQRREERLPLNAESLPLLGLESLNTTVLVDQIERKCLLRELSFSGAKVILTGVAPFLREKPFVLSVPLVGKIELQLPGTILRAEPVQGHKGLAVLALGYTADKVPIEYLRTLQKGFKLGLGEKRGDRAPSPPTSAAQTSSISLKDLRLVKRP